MTELLQPVVGEVWQHAKNGHCYIITQTGVDLSGHARHIFPTGHIHVYKCIQTGKYFARLSHEWHLESQSFVRRPDLEGVVVEDVVSVVPAPVPHPESEAVTQARWVLLRSAKTRWVRRDGTPPTLPTFYEWKKRESALLINILADLPPLIYAACWMQARMDKLSETRS